MQVSDKKFVAGDIFEIEVDGKTGYFQYIYTDDVYSACIRILPGVHSSPVQDFGPLAMKNELTTTFFPLGFAVRKMLVKKVGRAPLPDGVRVPPLMRSSGPIIKGKPTRWFLWNGDNSKTVKLENPTDEQIRLPSLGIVNDTAIKSMIKGTWIYS
jgi:hypothetical protein